jgi:2-polyprenyl-3-methyl-5-hydroxy-6-metoxy-1,4-benzoquinol methylase
MPAATYDDIADWYDDSVRAPGSLAEQVAAHVLTLCGDVAGQPLCDLACGQGLVARSLARRGAKVTGIDLSARLLQIAREYEQREALGIVYQRADAQSLDGIDDATFEGVTCSLALMDIPDLSATFRAVHRVLRPAGWFVFSITHPCFQLPRPTASDPEAGGYFREGFWHSDYPHGVRGRVGAYHRTLSTYLNALAAAGLILQHLVEPPPEGEGPGDTPVPKFLIARCRRALQ